MAEPAIEDKEKEAEPVFQSKFYSVAVPKPPIFAAILLRPKLWVQQKVVQEGELAEPFLWYTLSFMAGILLYFIVPVEPGLWGIGLMAITGVSWFFMKVRAGKNVLPLAFFLFLILGFLVPTLHVGWHGAQSKIPTGIFSIVGTVATIENTRGGAKRLVLDRVRALEDQTLTGVERVRLRVANRSFQAEPGTRLQALVKLRPPPGPVLPDGFGFGRSLYFDGIDATGFALGAPKILPKQGETSPFASIHPETIRQRIENRIIQAFDLLDASHNTPIALALLVGKKAAIPEDLRQSFALSGLAHIFAISGLHMALVMGAVIFLFRYTFAAIPDCAVHYDIKKIAIVLGLVAGTAYFLISGMSVSSTRAYLMVSIMAVGMLLGARAISARNLALAAVFILMLSPDELLQPGFQMSFAATLALVTFMPLFVKRQDHAAVSRGWGIGLLRRFYLFIRGIVLTSLIAGAATGLIAAYHFYHVAPYGVVANILGLPVFAFVVMPFGLIGLILMPFGLEILPFALMTRGLDGLIYVSAEIAARSQSFRALGMLNAEIFGFLAMLFVVACLLRTRLKYGLVGLALPAFLFLPVSQRPDILIADDGKTVALRIQKSVGEPHLVISGLRSGRFEVDVWKRALAIRSDGAMELPGFQCDEFGCVTTFKNLTIAHVKHASGFYEDCRRADILISSLSAPKNCPHPLKVIDFHDLRRGGAHALFVEPTKEGISTVRAQSAIPRAKRPWHHHYD